MGRFSAGTFARNAYVLLRYPHCTISEDIVDHSNHSRLTAPELTGDILKGATIYGPEDQKIGTVSHLHGAGQASVVVIDVGGLLGIGAKPVAVGVGDLDFMRDEAGDVHAVTSWTKDRLKEMPEHRD
jgi:hypothetical protein